MLVIEATRETTFPHWLKWGGSGGDIMSDKVRWGTGVTIATAYQWRRLVLESWAVLWNTWCDCLKCLWALVTHSERKHNLFCVKPNQTSLFWGLRLRGTSAFIPNPFCPITTAQSRETTTRAEFIKTKLTVLRFFFFLKFNNQQSSYKWAGRFWAVLLTPRDYQNVSLSDKAKTFNEHLVDSSNYAEMFSVQKNNLSVTSVLLPMANTDNKTINFTLLCVTRWWNATVNVI